MNRREGVTVDVVEGENPVYHARRIVSLYIEVPYQNVPVTHGVHESLGTGIVY